MDLWFYLFLAVYIFTIVKTSYSFFMLGACYGDPSGYIQARMRFFIDVLGLLVSTAIMSVLYSYWFLLAIGTPLFFMMILYVTFELPSFFQSKLKKTP